LTRFSENTYCEGRRYLWGLPHVKGLPPQTADITFYL
jgi:hypothetical protein